MKDHSDLCRISQITDNIFLSGIFPLEEDAEIIKRLNIKYILACVDRNYISTIHDNVMLHNPDVTILYLPYNDDTQQNLWKSNNDMIQMSKYPKSTQDFNELTQQLNIYKNKPLIEIGYHFINNAIMFNKNILVHCMAGISRSVSLVSYYFMKSYGLPFNEVIKTIKSKRIIANPNDSFKLQLSQYQRKKDKFSEVDANNIIRRLQFTLS